MSLLASTLVALTLTAGTVDDGLKSGTGVVESTDLAAGKAVIVTPAGRVTFITSGAKGLENLEQGKRVELKFFVNDGSRLTEVAPAGPVEVQTQAPVLPSVAQSTAGTLASVEGDGTTVHVLAPSGMVTFTATKELTLGLPIGQQVRVWHTANVATKIDVLGPAQKPQAVSQLK